MSRLIDTCGVLTYEEAPLFQKATFEDKITERLETLVTVRQSPDMAWYVMLNFPEKLGQGLALGVRNQFESQAVATQIRKTLKDIINDVVGVR